MERNKNIITCPHDGVLQYLFALGTTAETGEQLATECRSVLSGFFDAINDVVVPTQISVGLRRMSATETPCDMYEAVDQLNGDLITRTITDNSGVTEKDLVDEIENTQCADTQVVYVERLKIEECSVRVFLEQGWERIAGEDDHYCLYKKGEILDIKPEHPPIGMEIEYRSPETIGVYRDSDLPLYYIDFTLRSSIWLQETPIGYVNHAQLGSVFARITDSFDVVKKWHDRVLGVNVSGLLVDQLLEYEGPPVETLVEDYRRDWVQNHLRDQAQGYETDDGNHGVDFGLVTQQIKLDELKARLETYLAADESADTIDEVRVRVEDGIELRGSLTGDNLTWEQLS